MQRHTKTYKPLNTAKDMQRHTKTYKETERHAKSHKNITKTHNSVTKTHHNRFWYVGNILVYLCKLFFNKKQLKSV